MALVRWCPRGPAEKSDTSHIVGDFRNQHINVQQQGMGSRLILTIPRTCKCSCATSGIASLALRHQGTMALT